MAQDNQVVIDFVGNTDQLQKSLQDVDKQVIKTGKDYETAFAEVNKANQQAEQGTKQLAGNLQDLNKVVGNGAIKEYSKDLQGAVEKLYEQGKVTEALITKYGTATGALKAMQKELATMAALGQSGTKQFKELAKATAELQDTIGDTRGEIKKLASDTRVFDTLVQGARGMAAGFSLVTGTMAAFGSENENVQKALLKVQGAMAALQGVQELANIATEKAGILTQAYGAAISVVEFIQKRFAISSAAAWAAATGGVTVLVAAVVGLIYWLNKQQETEEEIAARKKALSDLQELEDKKEETRIKNRDKAAKNQHEQDLLNAKTEREAISIKISYEQELQDAIKIRVKGQETAAESIKKTFGEQNASYIALKAQILAGDGEIIESQKRINNLKKAASKIDDDNKKASGKALGDLMKEQIEAMREIDKMVEDGLFATADHLAEFRKTLSDSGADDPIITEETVKENKTNAEQMAKDIADSIKKTQKVNESAAKKELDLQKSVATASIKFAEELSNSLFNIQNDRINQEYEEGIKLLEKKKTKELENKNLTDGQKAAIDEKYAKQEAALKLKQWKAEQQAKQEQAIINGALAITTLMASAPPVVGVVPNPAFFVGLASIIASTALQVGLIAGAKPPAYAKGTEYVEQGNAPSGVDTVHARLNIGERVVPTEINKQLAGIKNEDLPKLLHAAYYPPMPHAPEMSGLNAVVVKQDIDYKKLGKVIAEELRANPQTHINIDKGGFSLHVIEKGKKVQSLNNRYES